MYIAMNRFKIKLGSEQDFIEVWKNRDSHLDSVPGFQAFNLLRGTSTDENTPFISHSTWATKQDFINWTESDAFRKAHAGAGGKSKDIYLGPPLFEGFESVL